MNKLSILLSAVTIFFAGAAQSQEDEPFLSALLDCYRVLKAEDVHGAGFESLEGNEDGFTAAKSYHNGPNAHAFVASLMVFPSQEMWGCGNGYGDPAPTKEYFLAQLERNAHDILLGRGFVPFDAFTHNIGAFIDCSTVPVISVVFQVRPGHVVAFSMTRNHSVRAQCEAHEISSESS